MHVLLMTATVTPPVGVPALDRTDPADRMQDYAMALRFYLGPSCRSLDKIVFVDNSDTDLSTLEQVISESPRAADVEVIGFYGLDYPVQSGKGYGEFKLLDHAFKVSRVLAEVPDDAKIWKVTGRLRVTNIGRVVTTAPMICMPISARDDTGWSCA